MSRLQYQALADPLQPLPLESGWQGEIPSEPIFHWRATAAFSLAALCAITVLGDIPRAEAVTIDRWQPAIVQPLFSLPHREYLFQTSALDPLPYATAIDWYSPVDQPYPTPEPRPYIHSSSLTLDPLPRTAAIDWYQTINQPLFSPEHDEYLFQATVLDPLPRTATIDWFTPAEQPLFSLPHPAQLFPSGSLDPLPRAISLDWFELVEQPLFSLPRPAYLFQTYVLDPSPRTASIDWYTVPQQPQLRAVHPEWLFQTGALDPLPQTAAVDWYTAPEQPQFRPLRSEWLFQTGAFAPLPVTLPFDWYVQSVQASSWNAAQHLYSSLSVSGLQLSAPFEPLDWYIQTGIPQLNLPRLRYLFSASGELVAAPSTALDWYEPSANPPLLVLSRAHLLYTEPQTPWIAPPAIPLYLDWLGQTILPVPSLVPLYWLLQPHASGIFVTTPAPWLPGTFIAAVYPSVAVVLPSRNTRFSLPRQLTLNTPVSNLTTPPRLFTFSVRNTAVAQPITITKPVGLNGWLVLQWVPYAGLTPGDPIVASAWTGPAGLSTDSVSFNSSTTALYLLGGTSGATWNMFNVIQTATGNLFFCEVAINVV